MSNRVISNREKIFIGTLIFLLLTQGAIMIHRSGKYQQERLNIAVQIQALQDEREKEIRDAIQAHMKIMMGLKDEAARDKEAEAYRARVAVIRRACDAKVNKILGESRSP